MPITLSKFSMLTILNGKRENLFGESFVTHQVPFNSDLCHGSVFDEPICNGTFFSSELNDNINVDRVAKLFRST